MAPFYSALDRKAEFLSWLESQGIVSYIPLRLHYPSGNQLYGLDRFIYRPETNSFECPEGRELKYRGIKPATNRSHLYRSTEAQCRGCPRKAECTSGRYKQLVIHVEEDVRQRARQRTQEAAFFRHQRDRRKIEALFGELKNRIGLRRVRLRRLKHVREQFLMAATAQNLKRLVRHLAKVSPTPPKSCNLQIQSRERSAPNRCWPPCFLSAGEFFNNYKISGHLTRQRTRSQPRSRCAHRTLTFWQDWRPKLADTKLAAIWLPISDKREQDWMILRHIFRRKYPYSSTT